MRNISRISFAIVASAALAGSIALPASAAPTGDTSATVTVESGALGITAPVAAALPAVVPGATTNIALGDVVVTDLRAGIVGWEASVILTDLTATAGTIPATAASYTTAAASKTGTVTLAETSSTDLSVATVVQTATAVSGNNTATWGADLVLAAPAGALAGDYTATLTHSVS